MNSLKLLLSTVAICDVHAQRLAQAIAILKPLLPFDENKLVNLTATEQAFLEVVTTRFAKLQDSLGQKLFPLLLETVFKEDTQGKSFIDQLNLLEKLKVLPSKEQWLGLRETRNHITHEYPDNPALMCRHINIAFEQAAFLLNFWGILQQRMNAEMKK